MSIKIVIKQNTYFDSVSLMALSSKANKLEGAEQVVVAMGTDLNKEVLKNVGMITPDLQAAGTGDLLIAIKAASEAVCEKVYAGIEELFASKSDERTQGEVKYSSLASAATSSKDANLAIISVPGQFAAREARKALDQNLHVMIFSDNMPIAEEKSLKEIAHSKGLLLMGPDCGTAILGGTGLCFANNVRRGNIGIVGASGTGSQEITARIHDFGGGVSQLIGVGGRDLSADIGGIMMIDGFRALVADENTKIIVLVSKPPAKSVEHKILAEVKTCKKPVIICFLGGSEETVTKAGAIFAKTTKEAALKATILGGKDEGSINKRALNLPLIEEIKKKLSPEQKYIRGLFCGGTLCDEAMMLAKEVYADVYSNIAKDPAHKLKDNNVSQAHTFIDFGDDSFTQGRPHPMIDPSLRIERFLREARDPNVGVILLDFIIGYGSHPDPVGMMLPAIKEAKEEAQRKGKHLEILGYVLGTDRDTPTLEDQTQKLSSVGVTISSSSANTGLLARGFVEKGN